MRFYFEHYLKFGPVSWSLYLADVNLISGTFPSPHTHTRIADYNRILIMIQDEYIFFYLDNVLENSCERFTFFYSTGFRNKMYLPLQKVFNLRL